MHLKTVLYFSREFRYLKSILRLYGDRLAKGKYRLLDGLRAVSLDDTETLEFSQTYFGKARSGGKVFFVVDKLNAWGYYTNKNKKSTEEYEAFYTANNDDKIREVKLFSFKRKKIQTFCTSSAEAKKQIEQYKLFGSAYAMPIVKRDDRYNNAFEISMVELKARPEDQFALENIIRSTMAFNSSTDRLQRKTIRELINFSYENDEMNDLIGSIVSKIDTKVLEESISLCMQHGDLSKENLMYGESDGKNGFWWIDWEHARDRVFFYDLFFYIINSAMYYDTKAFECYMSGELDELLRGFFNHFGSEFVPEKRRDYFLIFTVDFLRERVCAYERIEALRAYCAFINDNV